LRRPRPLQRGLRGGGPERERHIEALLETDVSYVVSACPTCTVALTRDFIDTFTSLGITDAMEEARQLSAKTIDFSTLVKTLVDAGRLTFKDGEELGKITYHDSCHLKRTLKASEEPRELLERAGHEIAEMYECDTCCGMAGSYSLNLPQLSAPILERKLRHIRDTGAKAVVMDCPGCVMQIRGGLDRDGTSIGAQHTVERLADRFK
jgi:L-lactate dehydrogenase complex protein LldF